MFKVRDMGSAALGERTQSTEIYIDTPKILKQSIISFESNGEIAAAALAYKCMEVAYMRVIFSMSSRIHRDFCELQASLHGHPFGQESSPSSVIDATNIREDGTLPGSEAKGVKLLASRVTCISLYLLNYSCNAPTQLIAQHTHPVSHATHQLVQLAAGRPLVETTQSLPARSDQVLPQKSRKLVHQGWVPPHQGF